MAKKTKKKTVMESLVIDELSGVDRPAQEGAQVLLIKRGDNGEALPDGSFPIVNVDDLRNAIKAFDRSKNKELVAKHIKKRAKVLSAEKELPKDGLLALESELQKEQKAMTKENEKAMEVVKKELQDVQDELAVSKAFGSLNDAEKVHYAGLSTEEQAAFLKLDADGRKNSVEKVAGEDPVIYTDKAGNDYRKSDDQRMVDSAKRADNAEKIAKEEREKREDTDLSKRAESELDNLPGDGDVKKALLKSVDGIKDQKIREGVSALLKASNDGMKNAFNTIGARGEGEASNLNVEYEKLAEEYAKEKGVSIEIARADVLTESAKGRDLAKRMEAESGK